MIAILVLLCCLGLGATVVFVGITLRILRRHAILDQPNERSSHQIPTPRGGGWGVVLALLPLWSGILWLMQAPGHWPLVMAGAVLLVTISWLDDLYDLPARWRLLAQMIAVIAGLYALPAGFTLTAGFLPRWLEYAAMLVGWLWFLNLYNFMDGIDGITGTETASIGGGLVLLAILSPLGLNFPALPMLAIVLMGVALGFLYWNWHPAKLFMGDVGSITLGYLVAWLLLMTAGSNAFWAALILPLYYCLDASITLIRRAIQRKPIWQAHREHFYQRALQNGKSHATVVRTIMIGNIGLIACAVTSVYVGLLAVIPALLLMAVLLWWLKR